LPAVTDAELGETLIQKSNPTSVAELDIEKTAVRVVNRVAATLTGEFGINPRDAKIKTSPNVVAVNFPTG
jgi:hypothetical protein